MKISLFIGTAVAATIFATIQVLDAGSADTMRGTLKELEAIAAAVVGGCLLTGGIWVSYWCSIWSFNIWYCINGNFLYRC